MEVKEIVKEIAPIIDESIKLNNEAIQKVSNEKFEAMEKELNEIKLANKEISKNVDVSEKQKQEIIAKTFRAIAGQSQVTEEQFKEAFMSNAKAAFNNETIATE